MSRLRRFRKWWICRRYGICPIHLTLMSAGGGYEPRWYCLACVKENEQKNQDRTAWTNSVRIEMCELARKLDGGR